jgi:ketosteroid isomerase-like protein
LCNDLDAVELREGVMTFREALEALSQQYVIDSQRGDAGACASAYSRDAIIYLNEKESVRGRAAITAHLEDAMKGGFKVGKLTTIFAEANLELGYAIQNFESSIGPGMVMLALKLDEGAWRVCAEVIVAK